MTLSGESSHQEDTRSLGEIVGDIATDLSDMVRSELELAKTEAKQEAAKAGKSAGLFGGAAVSGYFARRSAFRGAADTLAAPPKRMA